MPPNIIEAVTPGTADVRLIVFARTPIPGGVKTRLMPRLGAEAACRLHEAMIADTLALAARFSGSAQILFSGDVPDIALPAGIAAGPQAGGDLGDRLAAAMEAAFRLGTQRVLVIGSDSPHLPAERIEEGAGALGFADIVLGPADDGGVYLIGARAPCAGSGAGTALEALFRGIAWGTGAVFAQLLCAASAASLRVARLAPFYDLDEWRDIERLLREKHSAPHTTAALAAIDSGRG